MTLAAARLGPLGSMLAACAASPQPAAGELASLGRATAWLNSPALTPAALGGKVVLPDFWTYTCINWLRTLPYVRAWAERYAEHGLVVIGAHTPEFEFEKDLANVRRAVREMRVAYPVAVDSGYEIWRAFRNAYWPALYLLDAQGRIRFTHFGEGEYERSEEMIRRLLEEAGARVPGGGPVSGRAAAWRRPPTGGPEVPRELPRVRPRRELRVPRRHGAGRAPRLRRPGAAGAQPVGPRGRLDGGGTARHAPRARRTDRDPLPRPRPPPGHGPAGGGAPARFRLLLDGGPPGDAHGGDVDAGVLARRTSSGCTSWSASRIPSPTAGSRSSSWTPASRPSPSPSAEPGRGPPAPPPGRR